MESSAEREEFRSASLVALGAFNPAIFQPQWLGATKLIRQEEADKATIEVVHPEMTVFSTEWFKIEVTSGRFAIFTDDPTKHLPLRDLVIGVFRVLEHTPITAIGFNSICHFSMGSSEAWHRLGHHYAPKESWQNILQNPGLRVLVMEGTRAGSDSKRVWVRVEPSAKVQNGVHVSVNEHFDFDTNASSQARMESFLNTAASGWDGFLKYAETACQHLLLQARIEGKG